MRPLPRPLGAVCRALLSVWARTERAPGWRYHVVEKWGQLLGTRPLMGRLPNGCCVLCDLRDVVQRQIYFWGVFEPCEAWLFTQLVKPGMIVVDAGANIGQYTLLAARCVGKMGMVHAFEPVPSVFERLSHHVSLNKLTNVTLNRAALWSEDMERISLGLDEAEAHNVSRYTILSDTGAVSAPAVCLDSYADRCGLTRLDFVKIDIEGAEPAAIAGAQKVLRKFAPLVLLEIVPARLLQVGVHAEELIATMRELGYHSWRLDASAEMSGEFDNPDTVDIANVLFYPAELPEPLRAEWNYRQALRWARNGSRA
ncbi:MAG TPA: FkbM family methyltransferase [Candidatus Binataceae bacterium]|nr:FkbM family methyltransferase [Candidatus Binataceae bacterium]